MAEETAVAEQTLEQELTTFLNPQDGTATEKPAEVLTQPPSPETKPSESAEKPPEEGKAPESDIEAKLKEIPDAPEVKEEKPALTAEQQEIFKAIPTPEAAKQAITEAGYFRDLSNAVVNGDFETVLGAFAEESRQGFEEYLYQKYVAQGDWIDRWIAEKDGTAPVVKGLSGLEQKIARLEARLAEKESTNTQEAQKAQATQLQGKYSAYLEGMFDRFSFSPADRRYVAADITTHISQNPQLMAAYRSGNFEQFNTVVKNAIREYSTKDQIKQKETAAVIQKQEQRKDLIQGQGATITPKGDQTLEQELAEFFAKH